MTQAQTVLPWPHGHTKPLYSRSHAQSQLSVIKGRLKVEMERLHAIQDALPGEEFPHAEEAVSRIEQAIDNLTEAESLREGA